MPTLAPTNFNVTLGVLGGWLAIFGLVSYLCKQKLYLPEPLISLLVGVTISPRAANLIHPLEYAGNSQADLDYVILNFSRLVLGVQLVIAGIQLPSRYLRTQWRPLLLLLGPIMTIMWLTASLLVWALVPNLSFLHAMVIGACITPTDPVLSNVVVTGRFAEKNLPKALRNIIVAESGANDGLGYPFLFLALYLIKYIGDGGVAESGGARVGIGLWFGETWGYQILLGTLYGAVVGWLARVLLQWAEERKYVDHESFVFFGLSLALFIIGTCGMMGSDDVLACFVAGNAFTWDDWFRLETLDDSLQPAVDTVLNIVVFIFYGAVCPWEVFLRNDVVPLYRLIPLAVLLLVIKRLPWVFAVKRYIPQVENKSHAVFMGFFGPMGVAAIFYLYVTRDFLSEIQVDANGARGDIESLPETVLVVVWFISVCSIAVHGLTIPVGKVGVRMGRMLSRKNPMSRATASADRGGRWTGNLRLNTLPRITDRESTNDLHTGSATASTSVGSTVRLREVVGSVGVDEQRPQVDGRSSATLST